MNLMFVPRMSGCKPDCRCLKPSFKSVPINGRSCCFNLLQILQTPSSADGTVLQVFKLFDWRLVCYRCPKATSRFVIQRNKKKKNIYLMMKFICIFVLSLNPLMCIEMTYGNQSECSKEQVSLTASLTVFIAVDCSALLVASPSFALTQQHLTGDSSNHRLVHTILNYATNLIDQ